MIVYRLHLIMCWTNGLYRSVGWWIIGPTGYQTNRQMD